MGTFIIQFGFVMIIVVAVVVVVTATGRKEIHHFQEHMAFVRSTHHTIIVNTTFSS
jgi:hypothetical protein